MDTVIVSFQAPAAVYQGFIERDMQFHEDNNQLTNLRILVEASSSINNQSPNVPSATFIDLTGDSLGLADPYLDEPLELVGWNGDGSLAAPYSIDEHLPSLHLPASPWISSRQLPICVICRGTVANRKRTLPCAHTYCQVCIREWFRERIGRTRSGRRIIKGCPTCKHPFQRTDIFN